MLQIYPKADMKNTDMLTSVEPENKRTRSVYVCHCFQFGKGKLDHLKLEK